MTDRITVQQGMIKVEQIAGFIEDTHLRLFIETRAKYVTAITSGSMVFLLAEEGVTLRAEPGITEPTVITIPGKWELMASGGRYITEVIGVASGADMGASFDFEEVP